MRPELRFALTLVLSTALVACSTGRKPGERLPMPTVNLPPDTPLAAEVAAAPLTHDTGGVPSSSADVQIFNGSEVFTGGSKSGRRAASSGPADVTLDFANADVHDVARTVLGDILKLSFTVDAAVQGQVTLKTGTPITRDDVLPAFEAALKSVSAALVVADGLYSVVPRAEARNRAGAASVTAASTPGYGVEVVKLTYVSAAEMRKLIEPLAPAEGIMASDDRRGLIVIAGTAPERAALRNTMALFDVDVLSASSFALITPRYASAKALASDLSAALEDASSAGMIKVIALERVNAVLLRSPRRTVLEDAVNWVTRLDLPAAGEGRRLYYYRLQNAKASEVATALAAVAEDSELGAVEVAGGDAADQAATATSTDGPAPTSASPEKSKSRKMGLSVSADEPNNALIIKASPHDYAAMEPILREIDRAPDQVLIEATIAEVSLDDQLRYGVEWFFSNNGRSFTLADTGTPAGAFPGFSFSYIVPDVRVALNALASVTDINVVSSPKLLTLNNMPATLQVGDQIPIITQTARSLDNATAPVVNSVQFRDTGILLNVTPRIGRGGVVVIDVSQEVSDAVQTTTSGIDSPTIKQRKLETTVAIRDGQTVVLGGLMRESYTRGDSGVPVLKDIPLLGAAFRDDSDNRGKTELLIFIRPRILRTAADARQATEDMKRSGTDLKNMFRDLASDPPS